MTSPSRRVRALHYVVGWVVVVLVPAWSWLDGSGWLAWTMFSKSETYRLAIVVTEPSGRRHAANPSGLAALAGPAAAPFFGGADHWRRGPAGAELARSLPSLARLACRLSDVGAGSEVAVGLFTRRDLDAPVVERRASFRCAR